MKDLKDNKLVRSLYTKLLHLVSEQFLICSKSGPPLPLHVQLPSFLTSEASLRVLHGSLSHKGEMGLYLPAYLLWQSALRVCPSSLSHSPRNDIAHSPSLLPHFSNSFHLQHPNCIGHHLTAYESVLCHTGWATVTQKTRYKGGPFENATQYSIVSYRNYAI